MLGMAAGLPIDAIGNTTLIRSPERILLLYNMHTGEHYRGAYWADGYYLGESLIEINSLFRDYRTDDIMPIDPRLLDLLYAIHTGYGGSHTIEIISGYRSPKTNDYLRRTGHRVAGNSLHKKGRAVDITLPGIPLADLRQTAVDLKGGGVGYYPWKNFVHIDTGSVRHW